MKELIKEKEQLKKYLEIANKELKLNEAQRESLLKILQSEEESKQKLLDDALDEAIKLTESKIGYIYYYDENKKLFTLNTWSKNVISQCKIMNPLTVYEFDKTGIWGEAVQQRKPIVVNDFENFNPLKKGYPDSHIKLKRFLTLPVIQDKHIVGVVGVGNKESDYTQADVTQLALLMDAVWNMIERKRINAELQNSEERFRTLFDKANDIIFIYDLKGHFIKINEEVCKQLGYTKEELLQMNLKDIIAPKYVEAFPERMKHLIQNGYLFVESELKTKDNKIIPVEVNTRMIDYKRDTVGLSIVRNISDRKKIEKALKKAKEVAEIANKAKSEFLSSMSHEIRTPLNAIIGTAELLQATRLNPRQKEYVKILEIAGENLLSLIGNILDISKIESGQIEPEKIEFDLKEVISKIYEIMSIRANEKNIELICNINPDVPINLIGDSNLLSQVIINLIGNAIKFTNRGMIELEIKLIREKKEKSIELLFSVSDTGIGIPLDKLNIVFDTFVQIASDQPIKYEGSGLGLAISKKLVEFMNGRIWIEKKVFLILPFRLTRFQNHKKI